MYVDSGNMILLAERKDPKESKDAIELARAAINEIMRLPEEMQGWDKFEEETTEETNEIVEARNLSLNYQKIALASQYQDNTVAQKLSKIIDNILDTYRKAKSDWETDQIYKKMVNKANEAKDLLIKVSEVERLIHEDSNTDITASGLIGAFKLTPASR